MSTTPDPERDAQPAEDDLGVAATLPSSRGRRGRPPRGEGERRRVVARLGPRRTFALLVVVVLALAAVPAVASTLRKTPRDKVGISYGGGPFEGSHYQRTVEPGSALFVNGIGDELYLYPADQRNYIVSADDQVTAPTGDRVQVGFQVAVYYTLNTDRLREFHEQLGLRYQAYTSDGWDRLIDDTFRQQIETALQEQSRRHDVAELFGDADVLLDLQDEVEATLSERLERALGARFFCAPTFRPGRSCDDPTFVVKRIDIPTSVVDAFETNRTSAAAIETRENEVAQREAEARGIEALTAALEAAGDDYVLLKAIESGQITFWVLPDGGVSITAPSGQGGPAEAPEAPEVPTTGGG